MGVEIVTPGGTGGGGGTPGGPGSDTTAIHSGDAAGGDLTGTYPSPTIGASKVVTARIADNAVTLAKLATIADATILGNNSGGASVPIALTAAQVRTLLGLATVATSGSASDLSAGTLPAARLPAAAASALGGVNSLAAVSHKFLTSIGTDGLPVAAQPSTSDISGLTTMATDTLWDAAGDLAYGTGADTGGKLAKGTSGQILKIGASAPSWVNDYHFVPPFVFQGICNTGTGVYRWYNDTGETLTIVAFRITLGTVNTGATFIVDINIDGTTIFTTQANRPSIAASASPATTKVTNPDVTTIADGSYFSVDIDQIGSTIPGSDLVVQGILKR